ncbi:MAG: hypothetical protein AAGA30_06920 [Planctomycetota bacterium]
MPNFVAIEICQNQLLVACAKTSGRRYQINHLFEIEMVDGESALEIAEKLKSQLADAGMSRSEVIGLVGRQDAEIREVTVPPSPKNELPDLVRFQSKSVFASLNDNWLFDFVPFDTSETEQQNVLAMAIGPQVRDRIQDIVEGAGLKLKRIAFHPYAMCDLFEGHFNDESNRLLLVPMGRRFELIVTRGKHLLATRSFQIKPDQDQDATAKQAVNEVRRTLASLRAEVSELIVGADEVQWDKLRSAFNDSFDEPIAFVQPLSRLNASNFKANPIPESPERYSALIGSLIRESTMEKPVVDFLNPRKPEVKKTDYRAILIPIAAMILLMMIGVGYGWYSLNQIASKQELKQKELNRLRKQNEGVNQLLGEVEKLDQWYAHKVNWLDELAWISDKMLTPDDIIIKRFRGVELDGEIMIDLNSRMTKAKSEDTEWKKLFSSRYGPNFGGSEELTGDEDHPVVRPFVLKRNVDVDMVKDKLVDLVYDLKQAEMESTDEELNNVEDGSDALNEQDTTTESL